MRASLKDQYIAAYIAIYRVDTKAREEILNDYFYEDEEEDYMEYFIQQYLEIVHCGLVGEIADILQNEPQTTIWEAAYDWDVYIPYNEEEADEFEF